MTLTTLDTKGDLVKFTIPAKKEGEYFALDYVPLIKDVIEDTGKYVIPLNNIDPDTLGAICNILRERPMLTYLKYVDENIEYWPVAGRTMKKTGEFINKMFYALEFLRAYEVQKFIAHWFGNKLDGFNDGVICIPDIVTDERFMFLLTKYWKPFVDPYGNMKWYNPERMLVKLIDRGYDFPAVIQPDGTKIWYKNGIYEREDGKPVCESRHGKMWATDGILRLTP